MAVQYFTPLQALAHAVLSCAIRDAVDTGQQVPCLDNPARWDVAKDPSICAGCPVMRQCTAYADTGAVEHGIIAGRRIRRRGGHDVPGQKAA